MFKKYYDTNGNVVGASVGEVTNQYADCREDNYFSVVNIIRDQPHNEGYRTHIVEHLNNGLFGYEYTFEKIPVEELSDESLKDMFLNEILESITVGIKPVAKQGYHLVPALQGTSIVWEFVADDPSATPTATGTYLDPIAYTAGDAVTLGLWYTDGNDIWEAIQTGIPVDFTDVNYFDIIA